MLDLGCGHGVVTRNFEPIFERLIGTDPSAGMVAQAQSQTTSKKITFRPGKAEDMDFVADGSLDMVVAGQAAHCRRPAAIEH